MARTMIIFMYCLTTVTSLALIFICLFVTGIKDFTDLCIFFIATGCLIINLNIMINLINKSKK